MKTCPRCGGAEFYASQSCRGSLTIIVTFSTQGDIASERNPTQDGLPNVSDLDFDGPEGPFTCVICGQELELEGERAEG